MQSIKNGTWERCPDIPISINLLEAVPDYALPEWRGLLMTLERDPKRP